MNTSCLSCQKSDSSNLVYETKYWKVILSENQDYLGRCIIILKRHCNNLSEINNEEGKDFFKMVKFLENALKKSFNATMFNWSCLMNDSYKEKSPNPHVHWHFRPRYNHEVNLGGIVFKDLEFGHHYNRDKIQRVTPKIKKEIIKLIKNYL